VAGTAFGLFAKFIEIAHLIFIEPPENAEITNEFLVAFTSMEKKEQLVGSSAAIRGERGITFGEQPIERDGLGSQAFEGQSHNPLHSLDGRVVDEAIAHCKHSLTLPYAVARAPKATGVTGGWNPDVAHQTFIRDPGIGQRICRRPAVQGPAIQQYVGAGKTDILFHRLALPLRPSAPLDTEPGS